MRTILFPMSVAMGCAGGEEPLEEACVGVERWTDGDGDGYGDPAATTDACDPASVDNADDCDDADPDVNPDGEDDEIDGNCDGVIGEPPPFDVTVTWEDHLVRIAITSDLDVEGWGFGIAETGAGTDGWYEEDCILPHELCHGLGPNGGLLQTTWDVVGLDPAFLTMFEGDDAENLTYTLYNADHDCAVWGHDPSYYLDRGAPCPVLQ